MKNKILIGVIFSVVSLVLLSSLVQAATFSLSTDKTIFAIGSTFSVDVKIDSQDTGINAAQATVQFPKGVINVTAVDKTNSVFSFWLQGPSYSNDNGTITFVGGSTSGFTGKSLEVLNISFKVVGTGSADLTFTDGAITASDGSGTNVLSSMKGISFTSVASGGAAQITSPTQITRAAVPTGKLSEKPQLDVALYPKAESWYNTISNFIVQWPLPNDVTDVATAIDKDPSFVPTKSEGLFNNKTFSALSDGVWYLHVRFKNNIGWGPTNNYKIGIDTAPPLAFEVAVKEGLDTATLDPTISYETQDQPSGMSFYNIVVDNNIVTSTVGTTFKLSVLRPGNHNVVVEAVDLAGNKTSTRINLHIQETPFFIIGSLEITQLEFFAALIVILLFSMATGWYLGKLRKETRERRVVIAQRDTILAFDSVIKEIENLKKKMKEGTVDSTTITEINFTLDRISQEAEKMKRYVGSNIEEINE
jgi:hypothetical protein